MVDSVPVYMPKFGATMINGEITTWFKKEGDKVTKGEPIAEVMTDKITNVIDATATGTVEKIIFPVGEIVDIGVEIAYIAPDSHES